MKNFFIWALWAIISLPVCGQGVNQISVSYHLATPQASMGPDYAGGPSYDANGNTIVGIRYQRNIKTSLALETGLEFTRYKFKIGSAPMGDRPTTYRRTEVSLLSVPIYANLSFLRYLFVNGGPIVSIQLKNRDMKKFDQTGLGLGLGFGGKYTIKNATIFVNPYSRQNTVISFAGDGEKRGILELGLRMGIGYRF